MKAVKVIKFCTLVVAVILLAVFMACMFSISKVAPDNITEGKKYKLIVLSGSMQPEISEGDLITVKNVPSSDIQVDDVITFYSTCEESYGKVVTHKVVDKKIENGVSLYQTQGVATNSPDTAWAIHNRVIGKVTNITPNIGKFILFAKKPIGYVFFIALPLTLIIAFQLVQSIVLFKKFVQENRKKSLELQMQNNQLQQDIQLLQNKLKGNNDKYN